MRKFLSTAALALIACGEDADKPATSTQQVTIELHSTTIRQGSLMYAAAQVDGKPLGVTWALEEQLAGVLREVGSDGIAIIDSTYTPGTYHLRATSVTDSSSFASAEFKVVAAGSVWPSSDGRFGSCKAGDSLSVLAHSPSFSTFPYGSEPEESARQIRIFSASAWRAFPSWSKASVTPDGVVAIPPDAQLNAPVRIVADLAEREDSYIGAIDITDEGRSCRALTPAVRTLGKGEQIDFSKSGYAVNEFECSPIGIEGTCRQLLYTAPSTPGTYGVALWRIGNTETEELVQQPAYMTITVK